MTGFDRLESTTSAATTASFSSNSNSIGSSTSADKSIIQDGDLSLDGLYRGCPTISSGSYEMVALTDQLFFVTSYRYRWFLLSEWALVLHYISTYMIVPFVLQ
jgi:hypothetical protein